MRALVVKGQSILLRAWTLRPDNSVELVHHQNRTKRVSPANCQCQRWEHLPAMITFKFSVRLHTPLEYQPPVISIRTGVVASWYLGENHPTLCLEWVFYFPVDALTLQKLTKLHLFIVFIFQFGGAWSIVWRLSPPNPPCGDGNSRMWDMKVNTSGAIDLSAQQLSESICPFWASLPDVPDFRKKFAHFGQGWLA